jgi:hypothetical protein
MSYEYMAGALARLTAVHVHVHVPQAPEVYLEAREHGVAAEVYSLGVVIAELLTSKRIHRSDRWCVLQNKKASNLHAESAMARIETQAFLSSTQVTESAADLIKSLTEPIPSKRLGSTCISEIKSHPFFSQFSFKQLKDCLMPAPFKPNTKRINVDFSSTELLEALGGSVTDPYPEPPAEVQAKFRGYEFNTRIKLASAAAPDAHKATHVLQALEPVPPMEHNPSM